jgi:hypothetical protein
VGDLTGNKDLKLEGKADLRPERPKRSSGRLRRRSKR